MAINQHSCPKCNNTIPSDSEFCQYCGTKLSNSNTATEKGDVINQETVIEKFLDERHSSESKTVIATDIFDKPKTTTRNKKKILTISIISIVAIALIVALIAIIGGNDNTSPREINSVGVRTISFSDQYTAEYVLESWKNGRATEATMIEIMDEYGSEQGGGKLYIITRGEFVEEIEEWCFSSDRKIGDYAIIKNAYGYSLCYISSFNESPDNHESNNAIPSYKELGVTLEQYTIATMITDDPQSYCEYIAELDATLAKGTYGNDLKVEKASEYINNLPLDYGQKIVLFRIQFPKDTTYNNDIVDYLNERDDITYDEMVYILEELGFAVFDDGTVKW